MLFGGFCATAVGLTLDLSRPILLTLMIIVGFLGGALWAFIPGLMKAKFNVHEVVSTIMMNWVAYWTIYYAVPAYLKADLETESRPLPDYASLQAPFSLRHVWRILCEFRLIHCRRGCHYYCLHH